ncbi:hypothetical protein AX16_000595 [Volvariella volvacea WC 439]|nr:hypothetical protein AX16_000595 [Volvariella volvacea WC 439]
MSALSVALAAFVAPTIPSEPTLPFIPPASVVEQDPELEPAPAACEATDSWTDAPTCYSPVPSLSTTPSTSTSTSLSSSTSSMPRLRPNEHLAVLLPKHLWKPDSVSKACDNFFCRVQFSMFERRHHCRKCGGVYCAACSEKTTPLIDTSNLDFTYPPHHTPISLYDSPTSPVTECRVCNDCYDQIYGCPTTPRTPEPLRPALLRALSTPISMFKRPLSAGASSSSSLSSSLSTPPSESMPSVPRTHSSLRNVPSLTSLNSKASRRMGMRGSHLPLPEPELERSYGELDAYPLRRSSVLCKATGGGRWEPKPSPVLAGHRVPVPGGKAPFEVEMEREAEEERRRKANPIIHDGAFKYRFTTPPPHIFDRTDLKFSMF